MTTPRVSVVMPAFNVSKYIQQAIDSILAQTYGDFELIISDDASSDDTLKLIQQYSDTRIKVIANVKNQGYVNNMNLLFKEAKGEFIIIQDGDDYAHPKRIEILVSTLVRHPDMDMVGSSLIRFNNEGEEDKVTFPVDSKTIHSRFDLMDIESPMVCGTTLFRRKIVEEGVLFRDMKFIKRGQDNDLLFRISEKYKMMNIPDYLYYYRFNASSMTLNVKKQSLYDFFAWDYICFLKKERLNKGVDSLALGDDSVVESFFSKRINEEKQVSKAFYEITMANRAITMGEKLFGIKLLCKALMIEPSFSLFKKIIYVIIKN